MNRNLTREDDQNRCRKPGRERQRSDRLQSAVRSEASLLDILDHLDERNAYSVMNLKFSTLFIGLGTLLLTQTKPLVGQQIPASELPPPGTDTGARRQIRSDKWYCAIDPG